MFVLWLNEHIVEQARKKMALNERQHQIFDITQQKKRVSVEYLAKKLYVSEMTIRRDLKLMEDEGLIKRYHGGALVHNDYVQYPLYLRMRVNEKEKRDLAQKAMRYIHDGQTIFLNNSSSCAYIISSLKSYKDITVITNSVQFVLALSKLGVRCILTGGEYSKSERCLTGRDAENYLRSVNTDIAFLSCDGISDDGMVTVNDADKAESVRIAFKNAKKRIFLAHHSKLGSKYTHNICERDEADEIIVF